MSKHTTVEGNSSFLRTNRRTFLARVGGTAAALVGARLAGFPLFGAAAPAEASELSKTREFAKVKGVFAIPSGRRSLLEQLTREAFADHLNSEFDVRSEAGDAVRLELVAAEDRTMARPGEKPVSECFSILFRGSADRALEQGTHEFAHPSMGKFDMFIVPVGPDGKGMLYEAVFNRLAR